MKKAFLKRRKDQPVRRFHPWVFSGAIARYDEMPVDGEVVEVYSHEEEFLAIGHYTDANIQIRILSFKEQPIDAAFWQNRFRQAFQYRQELQVYHPEKTTCFRLIHAEGDGLPGLIVDIYGRTAVVQCHSIGMYMARETIAAAIQAALPDLISSVYLKSKESLPRDFSAQVENGYLAGVGADPIVLEHGHRFAIDWETGQKTGFFLDQRDNRKLLAHYANGKSVLNTFSYSGGFSIYALGAGARMVQSVDISEKAIQLANRNVELNDVEAGRHEGIAQDVLKYLQQSETLHDILVVDPPAYAKNLKKRHKAVQGYKRLNAAALKRVAPGGMVFTFSCSQVVDRNLFYNTIVAAAIEAGRKIRVMHHLSQPADHPVSLFHPEGSYLKGLALYVD